jgi:hypothetical protein
LRCATPSALPAPRASSLSIHSKMLSKQEPDG